LLGVPLVGNASERTRAPLPREPNTRARAPPRLPPKERRAKSGNAPRPGPQVVCQIVKVFTDQRA